MFVLSVVKVAMIPTIDKDAWAMPSKMNTMISQNYVDLFLRSSLISM